MHAPDRAELVACAALLLAYIALRAAAAWPLAFDLLDPEELLNLRLAWQLAEGQPAGDLGQYWYTGAGGAVGAGPLVLSLLYVPLGRFVELDFAATRVLAMGWSLLGALAFAGIGRQLLGRGGGAAALVAALALPPSWLAWTLTANGNYIEASALTLLGAWLALGARGPARGFTAGFVLSFSAWFCVSAAGPAALLAGLTAWRLLVGGPRRSGVLGGSAQAKAGGSPQPNVEAGHWPRAGRRAAGALIAGLVVGILPFAIAFEPTAQTASPVASDAVRGLLGATLRQPMIWPSVLWTSLAEVPLLSYREVAAADWAPSWLVALEPAAKAVLWAAFATAAGLALRAGRQRSTVVVGVLIVVGVPVGLSLLGVGPEGGPVESLYFYEGRRAALVLPLLALGPAAIGHHLWARGALAKAGVLAVAASALLPSLLLIAGAEAPARPFRPAAYLLCPADAPVERDSVCVDPLWEDQVAVLEALVGRADLADPERRREALRGFGGLDRDESGCLQSSAPDSESGWFGLGASVGSACPARRSEFCGGGHEAICFAGAAWAAGVGAR